MDPSSTEIILQSETPQTAAEKRTDNFLNLMTGLPKDQWDPSETIDTLLPLADNGTISTEFAIKQMLKRNPGRATIDLSEKLVTDALAGNKIDALKADQLTNKINYEKASLTAHNQHRVEALITSWLQKTPAEFSNEDITDSIQVALEAGNLTVQQAEILKFKLSSR